jgi:hypothetical protein
MAARAEKSTFQLNRFSAYTEFLKHSGCRARICKPFKQPGRIDPGLLKRFTNTGSELQRCGKRECSRYDTAHRERIHSVYQKMP